MTRKIIELPDFGGLSLPTGLGLNTPHIQTPITTPGTIADQSGALWLDAFGDRLVFGDMAVTLEQAQTAVQFGWEVVSDSERDGMIVVRRPDPKPDHD